MPDPAAYPGTCGTFDRHAAVWSTAAPPHRPWEGEGCIARGLADVDQGLVRGAPLYAAGDFINGV